MSAHAVSLNQTHTSISDRKYNINTSFSSRLDSAGVITNVSADGSLLLDTSHSCPPGSSSNSNATQTSNDSSHGHSLAEATNWKGELLEFCQVCLVIVIF